MENSFSPEDHTVIIKQIAEAYGVSLLGIEPIVSNTGELMPLAVDHLEPSMEAQAAIERYLSTVMSSKCQWGGPEMQIVDDPDVVTEPRPPRLDVQSQKGTIFAYYDEADHWTKPRKSGYKRGPGSTSIRKQQRKALRTGLIPHVEML